MQDLICYKTLPIWTRQSLPEAFQKPHNTQAGTWAKLTIISGTLDFALLTEQGETTELFHFTSNNQPPFIQPQQWHRIVNASEDLVCQLAFYCLAEEYSHKKYGLTKTHSEVITASKIVPKGKVLDLGCGSGRNAFYLQLLGFDVTALDKSVSNIETINQMITDGSLLNIHAAVYDINEANLTSQYDFIVSTVVMMFLNRERIPKIIENMQNCTSSGGYNLIVAAMSTDDYPCPVPFSFTFKESELKAYYQDWQIITYNENVGKLHKTDLQGNRIELRFATLLAKKHST